VAAAAPRDPAGAWKNPDVSGGGSIETTPVQVRRVSAVLRGEGDRVVPLELFFDLVFVLAFTQCTALMAEQPTWEGLAKGLLVLGVLWWCWVGYAWLTSVVNPEEGVVRLAMFGAMAALLVVGLAVPGAFEDHGLLLACAYGLVRVGHIALFAIASRDDRALRQSVIGLAVSTAIAVGILVGASFADGMLQGGLWALALGLDMAGPYFFGSEGWRLVPAHFAERHGLVIILALGESIVVLGIGASHGLAAGVVVAATIGIAISCALWWMYFDVVALISERRLQDAAPGRERNEMARDTYSYLHFPMVAGIVLLALGLEQTLAHVHEPLEWEPAVALLGGVALYLLAHVAIRLRNAHSLSWVRLGLAGVLLALIPLAHEVDALVAIAIVAGLLALAIAWETVHYGERRRRLRQHLDEAPPTPS
jgi:low temperature requirement protein LtrA